MPSALNPMFACGYCRFVDTPAQRACMRFVSGSARQDYAERKWERDVVDPVCADEEPGPVDRLAGHSHPVG
jgi:hypothetical protein